MGRKKYLKLVFFILWLLATAGLFVLYQQSGVPVQDLPAYIQRWVEQFGVWGPIVFILAYTLRTLTFFSATVFTVAAGIIFGPYFGFIYALIGANLSATLAYIVGRYFGKDVVARAGKNVKYFPRGEKFRKNGFMTVLMMRLLFFPYDWVGYLAGAYDLRWRDLALGTFIGIIPGMIAFVFLGGIFEDLWKSLMIFTFFFILGLIIAKLLKKTKLGGELGELKKKSAVEDKKEETT